MQRHTAPSPVAHDAVSAPNFPEREAAVHDLANLIDAASRSAALVRRVGDSERHLPAIEAALAQMGDLLAVLQPTPRLRMPRDAGLDVCDALTHAVQLMRPLAAEQGVRIELEAPPSLHTFAAPGLFRVVTDCIRNSLESIELAAHRAGAKSGSVVLLAAVTNGILRISIADDGVGPPDDRADPFRVGASTKPGSQGLGLAVARHIIGRLRGTATLEPGPGGERPGALLRIAIPLDSLTVLSRSSSLASA